MEYPSVNNKPLFLIAISIVLTSCTGRTVERTANQNFASLAEEQSFWNTVKSNSRSGTGHLEPFFKKQDENLLRPVNETLVAISTQSEVFVLVICVNGTNGILEVTSLAKNQDWQRTKWEDVGEGMLKRSATKMQGVNEDILKSLISKAVLVDTSDWQTDDADSVYVFLRYKGRYSRFAIYHPKFASTENAQRDPVAASLESLLQIAGVRADKGQTPDKEDDGEGVREE
jgi:hypothetical protein